tara:strand:+ start:255 stop:413 length:159 start_codon:yes stop_codon:yes gene_type:complete
LSAATLEGLEEAQRDAMLGERLYALISQVEGQERAGKITGIAAWPEWPWPSW